MGVSPPQKRVSSDGLSMSSAAATRADSEPEHVWSKQTSTWPWCLPQWHTAPDARRFTLTDQHPASRSVCVSVQLGVSVRKSGGIVHFSPLDSEDMQDAQVQDGDQLPQLLDSSKCAVCSRPRCLILRYPLSALNNRSSRNLGSDGCALSCSCRSSCRLNKTQNWAVGEQLGGTACSLSRSPLFPSLSKPCRNAPFRYFNSAPIRHQYNYLSSPTGSSTDHRVNKQLLIDEPVWQSEEH